MLVFFGGSDIIEGIAVPPWMGLNMTTARIVYTGYLLGIDTWQEKCTPTKHANIRHAHTEQIRHVCSDLAYMRDVHIQTPLHAEMHKHSDYTAWIRE